MERSYRSRVVRIGNLFLGGDHPVRVQSMTNTGTMDTVSTVAQVMRLAAAGSELVRVTARNIKEARNLAAIRDELRRQGCTVPLVADVHFQPKVAEVAASIVDKVRINPGNYMDAAGRRGGGDEAGDIRGYIAPLLGICREHGTALRIGVNQGSLSQRMLMRYGNTAPGMVESALEFVRICRALDFHRLVLSMKSSDVRMMIHSTRLLVQRMKEEGMDYPLHLGVTEAGEGMDGRIRSAAGSGALLADGIGDTVRVSLAEPPENELPVARALVSLYADLRRREPVDKTLITKTVPYPEHGLHGLPPSTLVMSEEAPGNKGFIVPDLYLNAGENTIASPEAAYPLTGVKHHGPGPGKTFFILAEEDIDMPSLVAALQKHPGAMVLARAASCGAVPFFERLRKAFPDHRLVPTVFLYITPGGEPRTEYLLSAAASLGHALSNGFGHGICIGQHAGLSPAEATEVSFSLLQFMKARISQNEYIACPTCGRTRFDVLAVLTEVKKRTRHLRGLKIAVMGCIVNGPGEMADADYGYVGASRNKVTLYYKQHPVKKNIDQDRAIGELIALMKDKGDWREHAPET